MKIERPICPQGGGGLSGFQVMGMGEGYFWVENF